MKLLSLLIIFGTSLFAATSFSSPAEQRIAAARQVIQSNPKSPQAYNDLAAALCRRARETGDIEFFTQAEQALEQSIKLAPGNYDAQKLHTAILLGRHDFASALQVAKTLNKAVPDDIPVWGFLAEANMALGNYSEAEKAAQWMLDLRPGNGPAFIRTAQLRELFGDLDGAIDFLNEAYRRTPETESEDRAFLLTETARLHLLAGDKHRAESVLQQVFAAYPEYHLALRTLAALRASEGKHDLAIDLLQRRQRQVKTAASLYDLAQELSRAGRITEAASTFAHFATQSRAESKQPYNANRELIFYYADHSQDPAQALAVAEQERAARHDVYTQDAYAWALFRNKKYEQASKEVTAALAVGVRDPDIFCHAGQIAASTGDMAASKKYFDQASASCSAAARR